MNLQAIDKWHKAKSGRAAFSVLELILAYVLASLAINSGSLLEYALMFMLLFGSIQNFVKIFKNSKNEHKRR